MAGEKNILVIGGGPAGMMAAGTAGSRGNKVILIEKNKQVGKKLMITGKGRCNITNNINIDQFIEQIPVNKNFLYSAFYTFTNRKLINFFNDLGLKTKVERGGRIFPQSDRAEDVVKALKKYLKMNNVQIKRAEANKILHNDKEITGLNLKNGKNLQARSIIIATGGLSYPVTGSTGDGYRFARELGHNVISPKPSLVPLEVKEEWVKDTNHLTLKNVSISVQKEGKEVYNDFGEMKFTDYGVSGPVILSASSHLQVVNDSQYKLIIDLKPALSLKKLDKRLQRDFKKYERKFFGNSLDNLLPQKIIPVIIKLSKIPYNKPVHQITRNERKNLVHILKNLTLNIKKFRPIDEAIVTSGGVNVDEIDPGTMESKLMDNLYFAGEVIDVDAYTGGFNLQIGFSTGYLAGLNCR